jgi:hypothetical protein
LTDFPGPGDYFEPSALPRVREAYNPPDASSGFDARTGELSPGRRTYQIFDAHWPCQSDDNPLAQTFNAAKKGAE